MTAGLLYVLAFHINKGLAMRMLKTIPALPVKQIGAATTFYRDRLGFSVGYHNEHFGIVTRDDVVIHLWAASDESWRARDPSTSSLPVVSGAESFLAGTASCRIEVQDVEKLYTECRESGVLYDAGTDIQKQPWGTKEFPALDLDRNLLTFFERA